MKLEYVSEGDGLFEPPISMDDAISKLEGRYPGKTLAAFIRPKSPLYVVGELNYLQMLRARWQGMSLLEAMPDQSSHQLRLSGQRYVNLVIGDFEYITGMIDRWKGVVFDVQLT